MAKQVIDRGSIPGDGTGDALYDASGKINANFTELYDLDARLSDNALGNGASMIAMEF